MGALGADACSDTELICTHKVGPLVELLCGAKDISVNETIDEVAVRSCRARLHGCQVTLSSVWGVFTKWTTDAVEGARGLVVGLDKADDHLFFTVLALSQLQLPDTLYARTGTYWYRPQQRR